MDKTTVIRLRREDRDDKLPNQSTVVALSRVVGADASESRRFLNGVRDDLPPMAGFRRRSNVDPGTIASPTPKRDLVDVPLFVGVPASATEWTEEYPHAHFKADPRQRPTFAVRVVGDCMRPFIPPGSTVVCSRPAWEGDNKQFKPGVEYVVCLTDGQMTFKVAQPDSQGRPGWFRLEPYNVAEFGPGWDVRAADVAWAAKVVQINKG